MINFLGKSSLGWTNQTCGGEIITLNFFKYFLLFAQRHCTDCAVLILKLCGTENVIVSLIAILVKYPFQF